MALLFEKKGIKEEAVAAAREALETYGRCAERNPEQFEADLEDARALVEWLEGKATVDGQEKGSDEVGDAT